MIQNFIIDLNRNNSSLKDRMINEAMRRFKGIDFGKEKMITNPNYAQPGDYLCIGKPGHCPLSSVNFKLADLLSGGMLRKDNYVFNGGVTPTDCRYVKPNIYKFGGNIALAMYKLRKLADTLNDDSVDNYDFIIDGKPVVVHKTFMQIGYDIIPLDNYMPIINNFSYVKQTTIISIIMELSDNDMINDLFE